MRRADWIIVGLVAYWAVAVSLRLPAWRDDRALWAATVETVPQSARAWVNHCGEAVKSGEWESAWTRCQTAIGLTFSPDHPAVHQAIMRAKAEALQALILHATGQRESARHILRRLAQDWPQLEGLSAYQAVVEREP